MIGLTCVRKSLTVSRINRMGIKGEGRGFSTDSLSMHEFVGRAVYFLWRV